MSTKITRNAAGGKARGKGGIAGRRVPGGAAAGALGKRERNKAENREEILTAAREIFTELGYDAATVRDVIRRTRLASGTFYNYFPDKESVFRALLKESEARRLEWLSKVERGEGDYEEYFRRSFQAYFEFVVSDRTTFDLLRRNAHTVRAFAKHDDVLADEHARLARGMQFDISRGALPELDAQYLAAAIVGVAFEVAVIMVERDPPDVDAAADFVTNLFLGFFARRRKDRPERPQLEEPRKRVAAR